MRKQKFGWRLLTRWVPVALLALLAIALVTHLTSGDDLKPFVSDGCSAFPDGTFEDGDAWYYCCVAHDFAYWQGGTRQQRTEADHALRACVAEAGFQGVGRLMLAGVRVGGPPWWPTPFRWGFGWPYPRSYGTLSEDELRKVDALSDVALISQD